MPSVDGTGSHLSVCVKGILSHLGHLASPSFSTASASPLLTDVALAALVESSLPLVDLRLGRCKGITGTGLPCERFSSITQVLVVPRDL